MNSKYAKYTVIALAGLFPLVISSANACEGMTQEDTGRVCPLGSGQPGTMVTYFCPNVMGIPIVAKEECTPSSSGTGNMYVPNKPPGGVGAPSGGVGAPSGGVGAPSGGVMLR